MSFYVVSTMKFYGGDWTEDEARRVASIFGFQPIGEYGGLRGSPIVPVHWLHQDDIHGLAGVMYEREDLGELTDYEHHVYFEDPYAGTYVNPNLPEVEFIIRPRFPGEGNGGRDPLKLHKLEHGSGGYTIYTEPSPGDQLFTLDQVGGPNSIFSSVPDYAYRDKRERSGNRAILQTGNPRS